MRSRGFSLLEALIATGLVFLVLGVISVLLREYSALSRQATSRDNTLDAVQFALREMRNEVGGAVRILNPEFSKSPPPGTTQELGDSLSFMKFRSSDRSVRFPPFDELPADYDPWAQKFQTPVHYRQEGTTLTRKAGNTPAQTMITEINVFDVKQVGQSYLQLTLSFQEERRHRHYSLDAKLWVMQP